MSKRHDYSLEMIVMHGPFNSLGEIQKINLESALQRPPNSRQKEKT